MNGTLNSDSQGFVEDYDLYVAARKVADLVFEYVSDDVNTDGIWMQDGRRDKVAPYGQTEKGLFLEFYYDQPCRLWTPWGKYHIGGSGSGDWSQVTPVILERLGATEHQPLKITRTADIGPVYALHKVDDIELPEPKVREHQDYLEYEVVQQAWANMGSRYDAERKA